MSKAERLERMRHIAKMVADHDLQPVLAAKAEVDRIQDRISAIRHHRRALMSSAADPTIAAVMLAQAERLRLDEARAISDLASARARSEKARKSAARSVGRVEVLNAIQHRTAVAAARKRRRGQ